MVDVDLTRYEDKIDAGEHIGENWLEGREVDRESEGPEQIRFPTCAVPTDGAN